MVPAKSWYYFAVSLNSIAFCSILESLRTSANRPVKPAAFEDSKSKTILINFAVYSATLT